MAEEIGFENGRNSNFEWFVTLTLDPAIRHTVVHHSSTSIYISNFIQIEETFCGRTYVRTDGHFPPLILLGRHLEVDLKSKSEIKSQISTTTPCPNLVLAENTETDYITVINDILFNIFLTLLHCHVQNKSIWSITTSAVWYTYTRV